MPGQIMRKALFFVALAYAYTWAILFVALHF